MFGNGLKAARTKKGLTQKELAQRLNISQQAISNFEKMKAYPQWNTILNISKALDMNTDEFLNYCYEDDDDQESRIRSEVLKVIHNIHQQTGKIVLPGRNKNHEDPNPDIADRCIREHQLLDHFDQLNPQGQEKAIDQVELLTKIPEYRQPRADPAGAAADQEGQDTKKGPSE